MTDGKRYITYWIGNYRALFFYNLVNLYKIQNPLNIVIFFKKEPIYEGESLFFNLFYLYLQVINRFGKLSTN